MRRRSFSQIAVLPLIGCGDAKVAQPKVLTKKQAIELAEKFISENGYTNLPEEKVKKILDGESFELSGSRKSAIEMRKNTLRPNAIGIKSGQRGEPKGWSVAFDYVEFDSSACRVVTLNEDGTNLLMQHQDGHRSRFVGFD